MRFVKFAVVGLANTATRAAVTASGGDTKSSVIIYPLILMAALAAVVLRSRQTVLSGELPTVTAK